MTKKLWFQTGIGILIGLLIVKYFIEIKWIFNPLWIILTTIFVPLLLGGVLYYVTEPLQRLLEKRGLPRWGGITTIIILLAGLVTGFLLLIGNPIATQVNNLVKNAPTIAASIQDTADYIIANKDNLPPQVEEFRFNFQFHSRDCGKR